MFKKGTIHEYSSLLNFFLIFTDFIASFACSWVTYYFYLELHTDIFNRDTYILLSFISSFIVISLMVIFDSYRVWRESTILSEIIYIFKPCCTSFIFLLALGFLLKNTFLFSANWAVVSSCLFFLYIILSRICFRKFLKFFRAKGYNIRFLLLIASGECGMKVYSSIMRNKNSGYSILTLLSDNLQKVLPVDGTIADILAFLSKNHYDQMWIAVPSEEGNKIKTIINSVNDYPITIRYIPDIFGIRLFNQSFSEFDGLPMINLHSSPMLGHNKLAKRAEDLIFALSFLIIISPLMLIIALVIKLTSPGPVIYRQTRIGMNNKPFRIMKFRSMPVGTEKSTGAVWAKPGEVRATKFGSFLRKTSLDELPQFLNVLKGEMSIVGPRPERPKFTKVFKGEISHYMKKHFVKAGITGWAQVNGWRGNTDLNKRIEYDLYYIEHWSLMFDVKIILMTIYRVFKDRNAY